MRNLIAAVTDEYIYGVQEGAGINAVGGDSFSSVSSLLILGFNLAFGVGIGVTLFSAGYSAIIFIMSKGDPKEITRGTHSLIWSIGGMALVIGSWALKNIVVSTLGVTNSDFTGDPSSYGF